MDSNPLETALGDEPAPSEEIVEPAAETPPAPQPAAPPEPGHVPLGAMLDEREKRQAAEKALKDFQARVERERDAWRAENPPSPAEQLDAALHAQNLRLSRKFAAQQYGREQVDKVHDWAFRRCETDPQFNAAMRASDDPYEAAMQAYIREQIVAEVGMGDLEAFRAWKAATQAVAQAGETPPPPPQQPPAPAPPRSLATAAGTGAVGKDFVPTGEGEAFRAAFSR